MPTQRMTVMQGRRILRTPQAKRKMAELSPLQRHANTTKIIRSVMGARAIKADTIKAGRKAQAIKRQPGY